MDLWKKAVIVVVAACALVPVAGYFSGWFDEPYVKLIVSDWGNVTTSDTELVTLVTIENPSVFTVKLSSLQYHVLLNGISVAEGEGDAVSLKSGTTDIRLTCLLNMSKIPDWWSSHIKRGETTDIEFMYTVKAEAGPIHRTETVTKSYGTVDTDLLSKLRLDQPRNITVPIEGQDFRLLIATNFTASWGSITNETTIINTNIELYNPHDSPITVDAFSYYFIMNNLTVGHGSISQAVTLPPFDTTWVTCNTIIDNSDLIKWFTTHIQNNETTHYEIGSISTFTFNGRQYTVEPINRTGNITTDMLG